MYSLKKFRVALIGPIQPDKIHPVLLVDEDGMTYKVGIDKCKIKEYDEFGEVMVPFVRGDPIFNILGIQQARRMEDADAELLAVVW